MLKQLNSLTLNDTYSCLSGLEVTHQTAMREVPGLIPDSSMDFNDCFFCFVFVVLLLFVQKTFL